MSTWIATGHPSTKPTTRLSQSLQQPHPSSLDFNRVFHHLHLRNLLSNRIRQFHVLGKFWRCTFLDEMWGIASFDHGSTQRRSKAHPRSHHHRLAVVTLDCFSSKDNPSLPHR